MENRIYSMARLKRDRPDLHERVVNGELTANGAMIAAGFRHVRFTVYGSPKSVANMLAKRLGPDDLNELIEALKRHAAAAP